MSKITTTLLLLGITFLGTAAARAAQVTGTVFDDRSGNGLKEANERGLAKIAISNGRDLVQTDAQGLFKIEAPANSFVFIVKPSGWQLPLDEHNRPRFFQRTSQASPVNFPLHARTEAEEFKVLVTTDPQVDSEKEIGFYEQSVIADFAGKKGPVFGVTLGDIVNDRFDLLEKMAASTAKIGLPWYYVNGNHDADFSQGPDQILSRYESVYGPASYAFEYAQVLFISLNDIRPKKEGGYTGGLTDTQFKFLEGLLKVTAANKRVVVMLHIPLFQNGAFGAETFRQKDRDLLFKLLAARKNVLVLSGHTHAQCHVFHAGKEGWNAVQPLHEYNVAAVCGSFWGGKPDTAGVPVATMWDGTPPGVALLTFKGSESYQADYLPSRHVPSYQIGLYAPVSARSGEAWVSFYANVFNGHDGWKVDFKSGNQPWQAMRRVAAPDPAYFQAFLEQNKANPPFPWRRLPDPVECKHLWKATLPKDLPPGKHLLEVRATEPSGKTHFAQIEVVLVEK